MSVLFHDAVDSYQDDVLADRTATETERCVTLAGSRAFFRLVNWQVRRPVASTRRCAVPHLIVSTVFAIARGTNCVQSRVQNVSGTTS